MTQASSSAAAVAAAIAVASLASLASVARADSAGGRPDERSSIQHAESVVVGAFTGVTSRRVQEQRNAIDASGRAYTARVELVAHEFAVAEHLDGAPTPRVISILVPGALAVPAPRRRVVVGVRAEGAAPEDGYNLLYGRALEADTDARLAELRDWVKDVRAPAPIHPQALAEAVGMHEAELRPDDPVPGGPVGPDAPDGPAQPRFEGPPRSGPQVIEPLGDPRHPPEPTAAAEAGEGTPASPLVAPPARRSHAAPAAIGAASPPPPPPRRPGWPVAAATAAAAVLLVLLSVTLRRRRAAPVPRPR
jgi:hypothetical protein